MEDTTLLTVNTQSAKIGTLSMTHGGRAYFSYLLIMIMIIIILYNFMMLICEFHVSEMGIGMNVYDPCSF